MVLNISLADMHLTPYVSQARPFNQALMYLRFNGTLVAVGMPGGNAMLNVPVTLLIGKVRFRILRPIRTHAKDSPIYCSTEPQDRGHSHWVRTRVDPSNLLIIKINWTTK